MSSETVALKALAGITQRGELRYFELVQLRFDKKERAQIFLCLGKHAIFLVKRSRTGLLGGPNFGEIYYAHISQIIEDTQSDTDMIIMMNENRSNEMNSDRLFISSENRTRLADHITVAWTTDCTWRLGHIHTLSRKKKDLRKQPQGGMLKVKPYQGCQEVVHQSYIFFIPDLFRAASASSFGTRRLFIAEGCELSLQFEVNEAEQLTLLEQSGRDHIRWIAMDYRQNVTEGMRQVLLIRNNFYLKTMNLANDIASWTGWEILIKCETCAVATIFLRRSNLPPMLDSAQDVFINVECPRHVLDEGLITEDQLLHYARIVANSVAPVVFDCTVYQTIYRDLVQEKIDALLFTEDALSWMDQVFGLSSILDKKDQSKGKTLRRPSCEKQACVFLKSVLTMLQEDNALNNPEIIRTFSSVRNELQPLSVVKELRDKLVDERRSRSDSSDHDPVVNAYLARVARFFAHCTDGFLLGKEFSLAELLTASVVTPKSKTRINDVVLYLLHARPQDMTQKFESASIRHLVHEPSFFHDYTFNDRVMQQLLELGWISKSLATGGGTEAVGSKVPMTMEYATFLAQLLMSPTSSTNLKVSIMKQIMHAQNQSQAYFVVLLPSVMDILNHRSLFLQTYATVTLVNLSGGREAVKNAIMKQPGIEELVLQALRSQDDDLTHYSLVLLTNLTKSLHHRHALSAFGLLQSVLQVFLGCVGIPSKHKILAEVASVVGQLCNDEESLREVLKEWDTVVRRFLDFLETPELPGSKLKSKVMFAARQICSKPRLIPAGVRHELSNIIPTVIEELKHAAEAAEAGEDVDLDLAANSIYLLSSLSLTWESCRQMAREQLDQVLERIMASRLCLADGPPTASGQRTTFLDSTQECLENLRNQICEQLMKMAITHDSIEEDAGELLQVQDGS